MRNPLNKRLPRELKGDIGKYLAIFLFLTLLISLVSGFLVADNSLMVSYKESFDKYNLEDGHISFFPELSEEMIAKIEEECDITLYDLRYAEEGYSEEDENYNFRIYQLRDQVNQTCLLKGDYPVAENEIAIDRLFAKNNKIDIGDTLTFHGKDFKVCGFVALPDYSCLFEDNSDMMFDSLHFSVAVLTEQGFSFLDSNHVTYNYAWKYAKAPANDKEAKAMSEELLEKLSFAHDQITDFLPRYLNKAVNFTGDDMGGDKAMFLLFDYIVIVMLAFMFAVTTSNTISQEAGVIGTLRASGYTRGEIIRHYLVLPVGVTLIAAAIGNILGYTVLKGVMANMYLNSYSLTTYKTLWNADAFIATTVIPVIMMFVINLCLLVSKLKLSPLRFLRHDIKKRGRKKAFRLNTKIKIMHRFRIRIIFQNMSNYITMIVGIFIAAALIVFSMMFGPMLDDYASTVQASMLSKYQYILAMPVPTATEGAESFCMTELETMDKKYMTDEVGIYGINEDSTFVTKQIPKDEVLVSNGYMIKYGLSVGDVIELKDPYSDEIYSFTVGGEYKYDAGIVVFMSREAYLSTFHMPEGYFTGYFSNQEITDIDERMIAGVITEDSLLKVSNQLEVSIGGFMDILKYFGIVMFLLVMYVLSKQIVEKNAQSISMTKILGFTTGEIGSLYIVATSLVIILGLLLAIPLVSVALKVVFHSFLYKRITGYIPLDVPSSCYVWMVVYGVVSYAVVSFIQMKKINKIPKSIALKNVE